MIPTNHGEVDEEQRCSSTSTLKLSTATTSTCDGPDTMTTGLESCSWPNPSPQSCFAPSPTPSTNHYTNIGPLGRPLPRCPLHLHAKHGTTPPHHWLGASIGPLGRPSSPPPQHTTTLHKTTPPQAHRLPTTQMTSTRHPSRHQHRHSQSPPRRCQLSPMGRDKSHPAKTLAHPPLLHSHLPPPSEDVKHSLTRGRLAP